MAARALAPGSRLRSLLQPRRCVVRQGSVKARADARPRTPLTPERRAELVPAEVAALPAPVIPSHFAKRALALHVAYVGSAFRGNQSNPALPRGQTVDDLLEDALFDAGHVLLTNYRSPGLGRLAWSRSSRTDKGVSSLATHVSCRIEVDPAEWTPPDDVDGAALAARLNARLPPSVRCFAALPVPRSFEARHMCALRSYTYLLPLRALTLEAPAPEEGPVTARRAPPSGPDADALAAQRVAALDAALRAFEGNHAFHNFTKRKLYAPPPRRAGRAPSGADDEAAEEEDAEEVAAPPVSEDAAAADCAAPAAPPGVVGTFGPGGTYWLGDGAPVEDRIGAAHFRRVTRCRLESLQPERCAVTGEPFVRIAVAGESFMLHQIRKMVASALAVARGQLPAAFLPAALAKPCRARMPMAPAATLLLADATFRPFKPDTSRGAEALAQQVAEQPALSTPRHVRAAVDAWAAAVLLPALAPALADVAWEELLRNLAAMGPPPDDVAAVLAAAAAYVEPPPREPRARREGRRGGGAEGSSVD